MRPAEQTSAIITRLGAVEIDPAIIRRYLAARRWRQDHVIDRGTYYDPTFAAVLRRSGSWAPRKAVTND